eukprot:scaffold7453_cov128-Isochrysis_galbana.AAC.13
MGRLRRQATARSEAHSGIDGQRASLPQLHLGAGARTQCARPRAASSRASGARADSHNLHHASVRAWPAPAARKSRHAPAHILRLRAVCVLRVTYCVSFAACRFQHMLMFSCGVVAAADAHAHALPVDPAPRPPPPTSTIY